MCFSLFFLFAITSPPSYFLFELLLCLFLLSSPFIISYSDIIIEREVLMQKYIHLVQIVETEKVAANQLRTQLEDQDTEIERLKSEVPARASACTNTRTVSGHKSLRIFVCFLFLVPVTLLPKIFFQAISIYPWKEASPRYETDPLVQDNHPLW